MRTLRFVLTGFVLTLASAGCGGDWGTVSGTVTLDKVPLKGGMITFHPATPGDGTTAYGEIHDGAYTIRTGQKSGLKIGLCRVTVSASTIPREGTNEAAKLLTPVKYSRPETSKLEADVKAGSNVFPFDLTSKP